MKKYILNFTFLAVSVFGAQILDVPVNSLTKPVVINTWVPNGFSDAARHAWDKLQHGGSALDAVEYGCNWCEEL